jgi:eukaryotic-like serine/threonine-protein kinase
MGSDNTTTTSDLSIGELFAGRYRILDERGRGGMGAVYAASDEVLGERVALKVLAARPGPADMLELFLREVRLARRVTHPNVVRTYDIGFAEGRHFLTMELVEGVSLRHQLNAGRLALPQLLDYARQIAAGLTAAHEAGVVHRDLKPSNVLITESGRVALSDFGIARGLRDAASEHTASGLVLGTPAYMAPEQRLGCAPSPATDLYAFGLIAYEMATGHRPPPSMALPGAPAETRDRDRDALGHLPAALEALITTCLAFQPDERPAGARQVLSCLGAVEPFASSVDIASGPKEQGVPTTRPADDSPTVLERPSHRSTRFAPLPSAQHSLAVLPFDATAAEDQSFAEALATELADRLCRIDGVVVFGTAATTPLATRDARVLCAELGAEFVVDGSFARRDTRARTSVRLIEAKTGAQVWADRFEGDLGNALDLQDDVAMRVAELLRLELALRIETFRPSAHDAARYLDARAQLRGPLDDTRSLEAAVETFSELAQRSPHFVLATAGYADALARLSFAGDGGQVAMDRLDAAVDGALRSAPWLPEAQLAKGIFTEAAAALARATRMAPTFAAAQAYLGALQVEAGRGAEGAERIELAARIDPQERWALAAVAKHHALHRDYARSEAILADLVASDPRFEPSLTGVRLRQAIWRDARHEAAALEPAVRRAARTRPLLAHALDAWLGVEPVDVLARFIDTLAPSASPRALALYAQLFAEVCVRAGRYEDALARIETVAAAQLIDVDWLERCEGLDPIRDAISEEARAGVERRASEIWRVH